MNRFSARARARARDASCAGAWLVSRPPLEGRWPGRERRERLRFLAEVAGLLAGLAAGVSYTGERAGEDSSRLAASIGSGDAEERVDGEVL
jgi:hypothetical protein